MRGLVGAGVVCIHIYKEGVMHARLGRFGAGGGREEGSGWLAGTVERVRGF
jgi:hypothetical protein